MPTTNASTTSHAADQMTETWWRRFIRVAVIPREGGAEYRPAVPREPLGGRQTALLTRSRRSRLRQMWCVGAPVAGLDRHSLAVSTLGGHGRSGAVVTVSLILANGPPDNGCVFPERVSPLTPSNVIVGPSATVSLVLSVIQKFSRGDPSTLQTPIRSGSPVTTFLLTSTFVCGPFPVPATISGVSAGLNPYDPMRLSLNRTLSAPAASPLKTCPFGSMSNTYSAIASNALSSMPMFRAPSVIATPMRPVRLIVESWMRTRSAHLIDGSSPPLVR